MAASPRIRKESTDKQQQEQKQQQQRQHDEQEASISAAAKTKSETPSLTKPADEDLSVPKQLISNDDVDSPPQSTKDTPSNVESLSQSNTGPTPSLDQLITLPAESSGKRSKPAPSVATTPQPPPLLLNVAELDGEGGSEGASSIGSMLKKLTVSVCLCCVPCHLT